MYGLGRTERMQTFTALAKAEVDYQAAKTNNGIASNTTKSAQYVRDYWYDKYQQLPEEKDAFLAASKLRKGWK
jgi:hypothetical protein